MTINLVLGKLTIKPRRTCHVYMYLIVVHIASLGQDYIISKFTFVQHGLICMTGGSPELQTISLLINDQSAHIIHCSNLIQPVLSNNTIYSVDVKNAGWS